MSKKFTTTLVMNFSMNKKISDLVGFEKYRIPNLEQLMLHWYFHRSPPKDKYILKDENTKNTLWWTSDSKNDNKPINQEVWDNLNGIVTKQLSNKKLYY